MYLIENKLDRYKRNKAQDKGIQEQLIPSQSPIKETGKKEPKGGKRRAIKKN